MEFAKIIKEVSKELNISGMELSRRSGQSPQNLSKKLVKGTLSYEEFENLMELMGAHVDLSYSLPGGDAKQVEIYDRHAQTQLTILEKQLEVERLKNKYFADISYEFRTALSTLDGGISLALKHCDNEEKVKGYLSKIYPAILTLTRLIEDNPFNRETGISSFRPESEDKNNVLKGKRVLLVDDNDLNREIVRELLEDGGMEIKEAGNGREALSLVEREEDGAFDFILMDLQMPVMNGFEATGRIRALKDAGKAKTTVIAMTASVTMEDRERARAAGMNGFIEKPLDINKLNAVILG